MGMTYWVAAPAVRALLTQADARWPNRNRAADGTIGDARHQAEPTSDHNPDGRGIVHAADLTQDPAHGVDCAAIAEAIRVRKDPRVRYVIFGRRIFLGPWSDGVQGHQADPWVWQPYNGTDPHTGHLHLSIGYDAHVENDTSDWFAAVHPSPAPRPRPAPPTEDIVSQLPTVRRGDVGAPVRRVQALLVAAGASLPITGNFLEQTEKAVRAFQQRRKLGVDGVVGDDTWAGLLGV
jgi:hypothetical protein